jgi:hypothetical protein
MIHIEQLPDWLITCFMTCPTQLTAVQMLEFFHEPDSPPLSQNVAVGLWLGVAERSACILIFRPSVLGHRRVWRFVTSRRNIQAPSCRWRVSGKHVCAVSERENCRCEIGSLPFRRRRLADLKPLKLCTGVRVSQAHLHKRPVCLSVLAGPLMLPIYSCARQNMYDMWCTNWTNWSIPHFSFPSLK